VLNAAKIDQARLRDIARDHGFTPAATSAMLDELIRGGGTNAQFNHPEFGGAGQWLDSGMIMLSDRVNETLKSRINALCAALSNLLDESERSAGIDSPAALITDMGGESWWPRWLNNPTSSGAQKGQRYAYFSEERRLAVDSGGVLTVYDTLDHQIGGVAQQQSRPGSLEFTSQHGLVNLVSLPVVWTERGAMDMQTTEDAPANSSQSG
jgi:hypothetical protein